MDKAELIMEAATRIFAEKGFHPATTSDISNEAGIAVGTIYNYFSSKDDILVRIFSAEAKKRQSLADKLNKQTLSLLERLDLLLRHHFAALAEDPALARVIISEKSVVRKLNPNACSPAGGMVNLIAEILRQSGRSESSVEQTAILITGMVEICMERFLDQPDFDLDIARRELINLLKNGI